MQTLFIINSILRWTYFLYNWNSTNVDILQWTAINVRIFIFIEYTVYLYAVAVTVYEFIPTRFAFSSQDKLEVSKIGYKSNW